ncbi:ATP-dependent Clp protease proteolytic subunit [Algoriphagus halophytocola]|uniref:ATP-dependent Clp protease proteolytic subunit n=1 Tax=Algoriphagus halophytocola TaxID=2991499 RepID=A0ABY6MIU7_9BACT|nr:MULTISPECIES: NfeD family protein [unclassified Algoriphagus]UZD23700.1 ATP-dependent Clp protease proteolytic subunit [Algoriphagus sp. TR-M5]WBL44993.1 ATP-dependent Clp protease proteolytic subunit [Algoriphagus sp. TR-M9]
MKNTLSLIFIFLFSLQFGIAQENSTGRKTIFTFKIDENIDPAMNRRVQLALEAADEKKADLIFIEMNTYGGAVNDADEIRTMILECPIPIYVFIDKNAASAGALISIATDSIYMAPGSSIGAATVVNGADGAAAPDKYQSYMRSMMRSTAEAQGRDPKIAEAMVDEKIAIEGITEEGSVVTFSASEAEKFGFSEGQFDNINDILIAQNLENAALIEYEISTTEQIIAFFLNPAVSGFLILIIIGGLYFELQTPGVGFPILASLIAVVLYFIPYYLNGIAENWEILIFFIGIILLAIELFVIPGFGVFGVLGIICIMAGLVLGMVPNQNFNFDFVPAADLFAALLTVIIAAIVSVGLVFWLTPKVNEWGAFKHVTLASTQQRSEGFTSSFYAENLNGKTGKVHSRLRPSGKIEIEGDVYDAYSRGEFLDEGEPVIVISTEGTSLKVKKWEA